MDKLDNLGLLLILILLIILWGIRTASYSNLYLVIPVILLYKNVDIKLCIGTLLIWLFLIYLEKDNRISNNTEGFKNNKLKKLKATHIGKTSERFANVLMSRGKRQKNKEPFDDTAKKGKINDLTKEYAKYKESFKPIFKKPSKTTGDAIYKGKLLWKKLKEIF
jgi:hypothetical protein